MNKLLKELDGAYLVRHFEETNETYVWHGGLTIDIFDNAGERMGNCELPHDLDPYQVEDHIIDHRKYMHETLFQGEVWEAIL